MRLRTIVAQELVGLILIVACADRSVRVVLKTKRSLLVIV